MKLSYNLQILSHNLTKVPLPSFGAMRRKKTVQKEMNRRAFKIVASFSYCSYTTNLSGWPWIFFHLIKRVEHIPYMKKLNQVFDYVEKEVQYSLGA